MTDYTHEILTLQRARIDMQAAKASNRATIKAKYAERIRQEVEDANEAAEIRFARLLAEAHTAGVPQSLLRSEVLRTNVWSRWTYWRDLAEIEPDRITIRDAKKERELENAAFIWSDDYHFLSVKRNSLGRLLDPMVEYTMDNLHKSGSRWFPDLADRSAEADQYEIEVSRADGPEYAYRKFVHAEIQRVIDAGLLDNPETKG